MAIPNLNQADDGDCHAALAMTVGKKEEGAFNPLSEYRKRNVLLFS